MPYGAVVMYVNSCKYSDSASHIGGPMFMFETTYHHSIRYFKTIFIKSHHEIFMLITVDHILSYKLFNALYLLLRKNKIIG